MVCFARSTYAFSNDQAKGWRSLIRKCFGPDVLDKCVYDAKTQEWTLDTGRIWNGYVFFKQIPSVEQCPLPFEADNINMEKVQSAAEKADAVIAARKRFGGVENFIKKQFLYSVNVWHVLCLLTKQPYITHWSYSPSKNAAYLVIDGRHGIYIHDKGCSDASNPYVDFDDGIVQGPCGSIIFPEWIEDFQIWKTKFNENPNLYWWHTMIQPRYL